METPNNSYKTYKFNFWKDRFWVWALVLPFGLICWAIPFVLLFGLMDAKNTPDWFPIFGFIFVGIPAYLVGWIFVYSLMEGIYTKVTITENRVSIRLPWLIFPIIPVEKGIDLARIQRINLFAAYGSRSAVFLYYFEKNKERHFYLPRYKNNPTYMKEIFAIQKRVEPDLSPPNITENFGPNETQVKLALLQKNIPQINVRPSFVEQVIHWLYFIILIAIYGISCWITSTIPPGGIEAIEIGLIIGFTFSLMGFVGIFPVVGQVLIWFFGRWVIKSMSEFIFHLSTDNIYWDTPDPLNTILSQFRIEPVHTTYTEFLFWSILFFSVIVSVDNMMGILKRRAIKYQMEISDNSSRQLF